jgi:hypothetical protein
MMHYCFWGNYIKFWCGLNIIIRIECILLKFHWGMKALIELHFQHEALKRDSASLKMYFRQRFHTTKIVLNSYNCIFTLINTIEIIIISFNDALLFLGHSFHGVRK